MLGLFRRRPAPPSAVKVPLLRVEMVGREHAGKSVLADQVFRTALQTRLPSGLDLQVRDPRRLAALLRRAREIDERLSRHGRETTVHPESFLYSLCEGNEELAQLRLRDPIGQTLTHTTLRSPAEDQARYEDYVNALAGADVFWMMVPCIPDRLTHADVRRLKDDVHLHAGYIRAGLARRRRRRPCVLAVVVNRLDARYGSADEARERLPRELLNWMVPQLRPLSGDACVGAAAVFPVTALGFGATVAQASAPRGAPASGLTYGEREWLLRPGHAPRAFNLKPLIVWSALAALSHREVEEIPDLAQIRQACRQLRDDLEALDGWCLPLQDL
jgi:hypothetical protein